jgi:hypothetical protein
MPVTVKVNKLSLVHRGSDGVSRATLPDVCKTPPAMVPVAYPNVTFSKDLALGTTTVSADGGNMIAVSGSEFTPSTGDEPGVGGGVISGVNMQESTWITYSMDVKIEGRNACRLTDKKFHNRGNTVNAAGELQQNPGEQPACDWGDEDGAIIGAGGPCGCKPIGKDGPPVTPPGCVNKATLKKIVFVNGIKNSADNHCESLQAIAKKRCAAVRGVYNKSDGIAKDLWQCLKDKMGIGDNPANDKLGSIIQDHVTSGEPLEIMAHSQGALITSRALGDVANQAAANGVSANLSQITVNTYGGAAWTYPAGPMYTHTVNIFDPVPQLAGKGIGQVLAGNAVAGPVGGALTALSVYKDVSSLSKVALNPHGFIDVYLDSVAPPACKCAAAGVLLP